jgi:hypothetical protein
MQLTSGGDAGCCVMVGTSKIASSRRRYRHLVVIGMFGHVWACLGSDWYKLLPQNVRDIIRDIVRDMNKLLPQKLVLLLYIEKQAYQLAAKG